MHKAREGLCLATFHKLYLIGGRCEIPQKVGRRCHWAGKSETSVQKSSIDRIIYGSDFLPSAFLLRPLVEYGVALTPLALVLRPLLAAGAADPGATDIGGGSNATFFFERSNFPRHTSAKFMTCACAVITACGPDIDDKLHDMKDAKRLWCELEKIQSDYREFCYE